MPKMKFELREVDDRMVVDGQFVEMTGDIGPTGELTFKDEGAAVDEPVSEPEPNPVEPPASNGDLEDMIEAAVSKVLLNAPIKEGEVDERDVVPTISHDKLWLTRWRDAPVQGGVPGAPAGSAAIIHARSGEVDISQGPFNAKGDGKTDCTKAVHDAVEHVVDGGVVVVPPGLFRGRYRLPATKSFILRGVSPWASNLIGLPGEDVINVDRGGSLVQKRTGRRNRHMYQSLGFWLDGADQDHRGKFNRKTASGWRAAHACIAYEEGKKHENKHGGWCNSYGLVKHCLFSQRAKGHKGGTAIYFGSTHYGWTFEDIEIGEHGSVAGTAGGIIDGVPSWGAENTELSSDSCYYHRIRHWNPELSLSILNQANSSIGNVEIYQQSYRALEVLGVRSANRKLPRDLSIFGSFYNDNELDDSSNAPGDAHIVINCESTAAMSSVMHLKGTRRKGTDNSPVIQLGGYGFEGKFKLQTSQSHHHSPIVRADGNHHRISVDAAGYTNDALARIKNDRGNGNRWDIKDVT